MSSANVCVTPTLSHRLQNGDSTNVAVTDAECSAQSVARGGTSNWVKNPDAAVHCTGTTCDLTDADDFANCCKPSGAQTNVIGLSGGGGGDGFVSVCPVG